MELKTFAEHCERHFPDRVGNLARLTLSLRRGGIRTVEQLRVLYDACPAELEGIRDIGPKRMGLIGEILRFYDETQGLPGGEPAEGRTWTQGERAAAGPGGSRGSAERKENEI